MGGSSPIGVIDDWVKAGKVGSDANWPLIAARVSGDEMDEALSAEVSLIAASIQQIIESRAADLYVTETDAEFDRVFAEIQEEMRKQDTDKLEAYYREYWASQLRNAGYIN